MILLIELQQEGRGISSLIGEDFTVEDPFSLTREKKGRAGKLLRPESDGAKDPRNSKEIFGK